MRGFPARRGGEPMRLRDVASAAEPNETGFQFSFEHDVSPEDRAVMCSVFEQEKEHLNFQLGLARWGPPMSILYPERKGNFDIQNSEVLPGLRGDIAQYRLDDNQEFFVEAALAAKFLFQNTVEQAKITSHDFEFLKKRIDYFLRTESWENLLTYALRVRLLFPAQSSEIQLDEEVYQNAKYVLTDIRRQADWTKYAREAVAQKLLFPAHTDDLGLDTQAIEGMQAQLEDDRQQKDWRSFAILAADMQILGQDAQITPEGFIECTPRKLGMGRRSGLPQRSVS